MKRFFREIARPYVAAIVKETTVEGSIAAILNAEHQGAEGFMVDMAYLSRADRSLEGMRQIFECAARPMMPLFYRVANLTEDLCSEEERAEATLASLDAGATAVDLLGNLFDPAASRELTMDSGAIARQRELIDCVHARGAEVLISSHMLEALSAEEVYAHLSRQAERGADIVKIVVGCHSEADLLESVRTTLLLKERMPVPFIHLCNGRMGRLQRFFAPVLGSMLTFGIDRYNPRSIGAQPTVASARAVLNEMTWHMEADRTCGS